MRDDGDTSQSNEGEAPLHGEIRAESQMDAEALDLTGESEPPDELGQPETRPYDPEPERELVRGWLAKGLFVLVAVLAVMAFCFVAAGLVSAEELEPLQPIYAALVTLAGTALGFTSVAGANDPVYGSTGL